MWCFHTAIINDKGQLYTFGDNSFGELGLGNSGQRTNRNTPTAVKNLGNITAVNCGRSHTAIINDKGQLFTFGSNSSGQLGLGYSGPGTDRTIPTAVNNMENIIAVSCGDYHTAIINVQGHLFTFGNNSFGQLGIGNKDIPVLHKFFKLLDVHIKQISVGGSHSMVLMENGDLYVFGDNKADQLCLGDG